MNKDSSMTIERSAGADAISAKAVAIGMEHGLVISECVWDMGADLRHPYAHRLDISTGVNTVRLYFSDLDLTTAGNASREERVEDRLQRAIAQLVARAPLPTYTYR
jgi:hypothetical protein